MSAYADFLAAKAQAGSGCGFEPLWMPDFLFGFQSYLTDWAVRMGRGALLVDCGMGKTPMSLTWAQNVHLRTGRPVLNLAPLGVSFQTVNEAAKFGVEAAVSRDGGVAAPVTITNYERLEHFDPADFAGVVCDESSILKSFGGQRRALVTEFMRTVPYRLLATATAAPNDYTELGTSSEALGYLGYQDMIARYFTNKERTGTSRGGRWRPGAGEEWRFRGHAEQPFWQWVASWARAARKPSDLGFPDEGFTLPPLDVRRHVVDARAGQPGALFDVPVTGLHAEREETRRTLAERCERAAELTAEHDISIAWCNLNAEGDALERLIPNSIQVAGSDSPDLKEKAARWFVGELCICNEPEFGAKLAAWDRGPRGTGRTTTRSTANSGSLSPWIISGATPSAEVSTCASTQGGSPRSSGALPSSRPSTTGAGESVTQPTPNTGSASRSRQRAATQRSSVTPASGASLESGLRISTDCSPSRAADAQSARTSSVIAGGTNSPLTTTTSLARSAGSSARRAISDSESSATIPAFLTAPGCICGHVSGVRRLISKASIYGFGLNFQHCSHVIYFPDHSYERWYQAVRRCWRFGQAHPVTVDVITTTGAANVLRNLERKAAAADSMFTALTACMREAAVARPRDSYDQRPEVPAWASLTSA